ncbi:hypothetical protein ARMGADRAFT_568695 [Armillaria gallica]|uniref:Uncharacterized protein n=1 Tax=Armillaria gallica TaxID=47427 RepID=A0A2H3E4N9_ARMGA|nr:hypothetical protein ARMGADRAFT_568695 [Armillaria gallica]
MEREVGCAENARSYPHGSLLRMKCQVLDANGTLREELLKRGSRAGTHTLKEHVKPFQTRTQRRLLCHFYNYGYIASSTSTASLPVTVRNIPSTIYGDQRQTHAEPWLRERVDACCYEAFPCRTTRLSL